jgi:Zn-dependent M28 family amino/carboxypeptidase
LLGSRQYVEELKQRDEDERKAEGFDERWGKTELDQHLLCVNFDVHGATLGYYSVSVAGPSEIDATVSVLSKELGVPLQVRERIMGNDHVPFVCAGIPGITVNREGGHTAYMHTPEDALAQIDAEHLGQIGWLMDVFLKRTTTEAHVWPFERNVPENQRKDFEGVLKKFVSLIEENETADDR